MFSRLFKGPHGSPVSRPTFTGLLAATLFALFGLVSPAFGGATCTNAGATSATSWTRWECTLDVQGVNGTLSGRNPYLMKLKVTYTAAGQQTRTGYASWDGLINAATNTHRFRLRAQFPPAAGALEWKWTTTCESPSYCSADTTKTSPSLVSSGIVTVSKYSGANPLYTGGPIRILSNNFYYYPELYQGNNRFAWVGDSAWAGPMRATTAEWDAYLENRRSFTDPTKPSSANATILQIGPAPSWAGFPDPAGIRDTDDPTLIRTGDFNRNPPFDQLSGCTSSAVVPNVCSVPNMAFWRAFEEKVEKANQKGLYLFLAGVMEPYKRYPSNDEAVRFACWLVGRLSGNFVIFSPGFDSPPSGTSATSLIKAVGTAIRATSPHHLITNHWSTSVDNVNNTYDQMASIHAEPWFSFALYQSGFLNGNEPLIAQRARELAQVVAGHANLPGYPIFSTTRKATVNGEAVYDEGGLSANPRRPAFRAYRARHAGYVSWLAGSFGYTHGSGGLWDWGACGVALPNPCLTYQMPTGYRTPTEAMNSTGQAFRNVKFFGEALRRSATDAINTREQWRVKNLDAEDKPLPEDKKMVVARHWNWMMVYMPHNDKVQLEYVISGTTASTSMNPATAKLWNPADGVLQTDTPAYSCPAGGTYCIFSNRNFDATNPDASDRILVLTPGATNTWFQTNPHNLEVFVGRFSEEESQGVYGQELNEADQPVGKPFLLHRAGNQEPATPAAGRDGKGKFLVVWSTDTDRDSLKEVWGKWVELGSTNRLPPAFRISPADGSEHFEPSVAVSGDGTATVAWTRAYWPIHGKEIWARSVNATTLEEPEVICQGEGKDCAASKVAASLDGRVSIAWVESEEAIGQPRIQMLSFAGNDLRVPANVLQQVNEVEAPVFWLVNLHIDAAGVVVAEYEGMQDGASVGVYTQAFDAAGNRLGAEQLVALPTADP